MIFRISNNSADTITINEKQAESQPKQFLFEEKELLKIAPPKQIFNEIVEQVVINQPTEANFQKCYFVYGYKTCGI